MLKWQSLKSNRG